MGAFSCIVSPMLKNRFTRKLVAVFGAIGALVVLVLFMFQLTGIAAQSVSAGIVFPIEHIALMLLCFILGGLSVNLRSSEMIVLPLGFVFILIANLGMHMGFLSTTLAGPMAAGAVMLLLIATLFAYGLRMFALLFLASLAAHAIASMTPSQTTHIEAVYFMIGLSISTLLLLASGLCFSFTTKGLTINSKTKKPSPIVYRPVLTTS